MYFLQWHFIILMSTTEIGSGEMDNNELLRVQESHQVFPTRPHFILFWNPVVELHTVFLWLDKYVFSCSLTCRYVRNFFSLFFYILNANVSNTWNQLLFPLGWAVNLSLQHCPMFAALNSHWTFLQACWMNWSDRCWTRNYECNIPC